MNITCGWYITAPENHTIKVKITSKLSSSRSSKDSVEVYDVEGSELSAISFDYKDTVFSKFHKVYVLFKSDDQPQSSEKGISVSYTAMKIGKPDHISSSCNCLVNAFLVYELPFTFVGKVKVMFHRTNFESIMRTLFTIITIRFLHYFSTIRHLRKAGQGINFRKGGRPSRKRD